MGIYRKRKKREKGRKKRGKKLFCCSWVCALSLLFFIFLQVDPTRPTGPAQAQMGLIRGPNSWAWPGPITGLNWPGPRTTWIGLDQAFLRTGRPHFHLYSTSLFDNSTLNRTRMRLIFQNNIFLINIYKSRHPPKLFSKLGL